MSCSKERGKGRRGKGEEDVRGGGVSGGDGSCGFDDEEDEGPGWSVAVTAVVVVLDAAAFVGFAFEVRSSRGMESAMVCGWVDGGDLEKSKGVNARSTGRKTLLRKYLWDVFILAHRKVGKSIA